MSSSSSSTHDEVNLLSLPQEMREEIFLLLVDDLDSLNSLLRTCKEIHKSIRESSRFWTAAAEKRKKLVHWQSEIRQPTSVFPTTLPLPSEGEVCFEDKRFLARYLDAKRNIESGECRIWRLGYDGIVTLMRDDTMFECGKCASSVDAAAAATQLGEAEMDSNIGFHAHNRPGENTINVYKTSSPPTSCAPAPKLLGVLHDEEMDEWELNFNLWKEYVLIPFRKYHQRDPKTKGSKDTSRHSVLWLTKVVECGENEEKWAYVDDDVLDPVEYIVGHELGFLEVLQSQGTPDIATCVVLYSDIGKAYLVEIPECRVVKTIEIDSCSNAGFDYNVEHRPYFREAISIMIRDVDGTVGRNSISIIVAGLYIF